MVRILPLLCRREDGLLVAILVSLGANVTLSELSVVSNVGSAYWTRWPFGPANDSVRVSSRVAWTYQDCGSAGLTVNSLLKTLWRQPTVLTLLLNCLLKLCLLKMKKRRTKEPRVSGKLTSLPSCVINKMLVSHCCLMRCQNLASHRRTSWPGLNQPSLVCLLLILIFLT